MTIKKTVKQPRPYLEVTQMQEDIRIMKKTLEDNGKEICILQTQMSDVRSDMSEIKYSLTSLIQKMDDFPSALEKKFTTKSEFEPVKLITFGMVGIILTTVIGALIALVIKQ